MSVARLIDLPDELFSSDDDEVEPDPIPETLEFQELVAAMEKKQDRKKQRANVRTVAASKFDRTLSEVDVMILSSNWDGAKPRHLVALYDRMHTKIYGVECVELGPTERYNTVMQALTLVKSEFEGDAENAVEFMRWVWSREMNKLKWCRENGHGTPNRITPWKMFSKSFVTDYRVALAQSRHRK